MMRWEIGNGERMGVRDVHRVNRLRSQNAWYQASRRFRENEPVPTDIPAVVLAGLRNWHNLPEPIRRAVEVLLESAEE